MKAIRYLSAGLLFFLCVINLGVGIITWPEPGFVMYMVVGIVYFTLGLLLTTKYGIALWLGLLIPLALLFVYPVVVDLKYLNPWLSGVMGSFDAIVAICCLIMLLLKL